MMWGREESDEARFRRAELKRFKHANRRRLVDMLLGGLLIAAIVAVIFWLIGLSPPPPHEPESLNGNGNGDATRAALVIDVAG